MLTACKGIIIDNFRYPALEETILTLYFTCSDDDIEPIRLEFRKLGEVPGYGYVYALMHVSALSYNLFLIFSFWPIIDLSLLRATSYWHFSRHA
jgi:hypothetical protein